jgi:2-keto-4-pentenoate hydratase
MNDDPGGTDTVTRCAEALAQAELKRRPTQPLTERFPELSLLDAYRIQQANILRRTKQGERIVGHKVGLTAKAMQDLFGVREPDYGHLLNTMVHDPSKALDLSELIDPQIEVEPAFILGKRLIGPDVGIDEVLHATDYVSVCFEVIDSRIENWRIKIQDTVADNGSSARVILGKQRMRTPGLNLENMDTVLELDGTVVATGNTGAILGHPANGVAWLANAIAKFGVALEAGAIVLPGTCTRSCRIAGHRNVKGRIAGLGEVSITLENSPFVTKSGAT